MAKLSQDEKTILAMFSYMRPSGTPTETMFIERFLTPLGFTRDPFQNLVLTVGDKPRILWSSHVDTVHGKEGIQTLAYDGEMLTLSKGAKLNSSCLGADDTAGIWLMTEMIKANVPGVYVIHHAEENGCVGSRDLARGNPEFFADIDAAIAFDRMGYDSVITHQMGMRTASDRFALSFSMMLDDALGDGSKSKYAADDGGAYTDTNEYSHLVPECTNISVGYHSQHTRNESQHVGHLIALRNLLVKADLSTLVIARDPAQVEYAGSRGFYRGGFFGHGNWDHDDPWDNPKNYTAFPDRRSTGSMEDLVRAYPDVAANILASYGMSRNTLMDEIADMYGDAALEAV
ncbi:M28 family peptidase [Pararhizobium sp. A13]|uniref:M28 family peptidase n=1 Tax=Pararhizobium sp. A13 TaxID=3133975 RepID=UPI0032550F1F